MNNNNVRWIFTLVGFIFVLLTTAFGYTWGSVADNRREIQRLREGVYEKIEILVKDVSYIKAYIDSGKLHK